MYYLLQGLESIIVIKIPRKLQGSIKKILDEMNSSFIFFQDSFSKNKLINLFFSHKRNLGKHFRTSMVGPCSLVTNCIRGLSHACPIFLLSSIIYPSLDLPILQDSAHILSPLCCILWLLHGDLKDLSSASCFNRWTYREQINLILVTLMVTVHYSERTLIKVSKGKRYIGASDRA